MNRPAFTAGLAILGIVSAISWYEDYVGISMILMLASGFLWGVAVMDFYIIANLVVGTMLITSKPICQECLDQGRLHMLTEEEFERGSYSCNTAMRQGSSCQSHPDTTRG